MIKYRPYVYEIKLLLRFVVSRLRSCHPDSKTNLSEWLRSASMLKLAKSLIT
ncbi:unnamed protein product [Spodoptera exigua]|nr:unnamed protein product [Spodoptera exigua]